MAQHNKKKVTILSIDGGGIRGLIPAVFLARLEKEIQRITNNSEARLSEYFDLMIGTSTGGLLSILYATPSEDGTRSKYSAEEGVKLYKKHGPMIFPSSWFWARKFFRNKYSPNYLNNLLLRKLGDTKLGSLRTPVAITAFNTTTDSAYIFRSWRASNQAQDFYLRDVARATSAAPTYFPPAEFGFVGMNSDATPKQSFIDGGVSANNPSLIALGNNYLVLIMC
jgi:patatin-like phospholipase/acyl hydrolase